MRGFVIRYIGLSVALVVIFSGFIACGSQLYLVSLDKDFDETRTSTASRDPNSAMYGIHALSGWSQLPIEFRFGQELNNMQKTALMAAMRTWEQAVGRKLFKFNGIHNGVSGDAFPSLYDSLSDQVNGHYMLSNWRKTQKPVVVLATTVWDNIGNDASIIGSADIHFNAENYNIGDSLFLTSVGDRQVVDMESLALHELGHLLGLGHIEGSVDATSIMNPQLYIGEGLTSRKISKEDIRRIQQIYGCEGDSCDIDATFLRLETRIDQEIAAAAVRNATPEEAAH